MIWKRMTFEVKFDIYERFHSGFYSQYGILHLSKSFLKQYD